MCVNQDPNQASENDIDGSQESITLYFNPESGELKSVEQSIMESINLLNNKEQQMFQRS